jgi:hypothetical protein
MVTRQNDFIGIDGILGLSQNYTFAMGGDPSVDLKVGPLFINHLQKQG